MDGACPAHDERNCNASTSSPDSQITRWRSAVCPHPNRPEVNIHEAYLAAPRQRLRFRFPLSDALGRERRAHARNGGLANEVKSYAQRIARPTRDSSKNPQLVGNYNTARVGSALSSFSPPPPPHSLTHSLTLPHNLSPGKALLLFSIVRLVVCLPSDPSCCCSPRSCLASSR